VSILSPLWPGQLRCSLDSLVFRLGAHAQYVQAVRSNVESLLPALVVKLLKTKRGREEATAGKHPSIPKLLASCCFATNLPTCGPRIEKKKSAKKNLACVFLFHPINPQTLKLSFQTFDSQQIMILRTSYRPGRQTLHGYDLTAWFHRAEGRKALAVHQHHHHYFNPYSSQSPLLEVLSKGSKNSPPQFVRSS
jgi:hypothetical protein